MAKNIFYFLAFAAIAAILNAIMFPGYMEGPYAEGVGKALVCWGIGYIFTYSVKNRRSEWLFGSSVIILVFFLVIQPALIGGFN